MTLVAERQEWKLIKPARLLESHPSSHLDEFHQVFGFPLHTAAIHKCEPQSVESLHLWRWCHDCVGRYFTIDCFRRMHPWKDSRLESRHSLPRRCEYPVIPTSVFSSMGGH
jgi:hypothetical protein